MRLRAWGRGRPSWLRNVVLSLCGLVLAAASATTPSFAQDAPARPVTIFAAASASNVINAVAAAFQAQGGAQVRPVFASSSTLARQITQGAPADLYLSANERWMDFVADRGFLAPGSRIDLLANRLVLIAPARHAFEIAVEPGFAIDQAIGRGHVAMGDPSHVPAGIYAKAALERLGVWERIKDKAAFAADVRAALALVERGEARAGIVYATDAAMSSKVVVAGRFPRESHPPIVYPLGIVAGRQHKEVEDFYRFLRSPQAGAIFRAHGFIVIAPGAEG